MPQTTRTTLPEFIALVVLLLVCTWSSSSSAQSIHSDDPGNCTGSGLDTYTDSLGNTTGPAGHDTVRGQLGLCQDTVGG